MKHPALTRVFAIVLAVMCLVMLLAGVIGIRSNADERQRAQSDQERLSARIEEYRQILGALKGTVSYDESNKELEERQELHDDEAAQHRVDLATYTATRGGLKEGIAALDEADAAFAAGKQQYLDGLKEFEKQEAAFNKGYAQFQEGKQQLAEGWAQYNTLSDALQAAQGELAGLTAISDILADEETDDAEALQSAAIAAYDGALSSFDQAIGVTEAVKAQGGISAEQIQMLLGALTENPDISLADIPVEGITAEQMQQFEDAIVEATGMTPDQIRTEMQTQRSELESGDAELLLSPEQFAAVRQVFRENKELVQTAIQAVSGRVDELGGTLEETRAQLDAAQAEMDKLEAVMEQGKAGIEAGRKALQEAGKQIDVGEAALYEGRAQIWYQLGKLEEQEEELRQEKEVLDQEAEELTEMNRRAEEQKELEEQETSVRLMLLSRDEIAQRVEDGADLMSAAEDYAAQYAADTEHRYTGRMWVNLLMLLGALCGCIGIPAAFEKTKNRGMLIIPVLLSLACAVAAEIQCLQLGRGNSYSALAVAIFAGIQLLLVLPKPSAKT